MQLSGAVTFAKSMPKLSADDGSAMQAQYQDIRSQQLGPSWTDSLDIMPTCLQERSHDVNERTTKVLPCGSPTDLNASNEGPYPSSPLECAALDSLRFLGISLMPSPLLAVVCGIDSR